MATLSRKPYLAKTQYLYLLLIWLNLNQFSYKVHLFIITGQPMESATSNKHKSEPQTGILTPTQDAEQATPPTKKKKTMASTGLAQPSTVVTVVGRNYKLLQT